MHQTIEPQLLDALVFNHYSLFHVDAAVGRMKNGGTNDEDAFSGNGQTKAVGWVRSSIKRFCFLGRGWVGCCCFHMC